MQFVKDPGVTVDGDVTPSLPEGRRRVRRWSNYFGGWVSAAIFVGVCFLGDPLGGYAVDGRPTIGGWLFALCFLLPPVVLLHLLSSPVLLLDGDRWTIRNPIRTWRFSNGCVTRVSDSALGYPRVHLSDGTTVLVGALEETNLSAYRGTAPMTDRLVREHASIPAEDGSTAVEKTWTPPYWGSLVVVAAWLGYVVYFLIVGPYGGP